MNAFAEFTAIHTFQRFLNGLQPLEVGLMQVVEQFLIVADCGKIAFIFSIFQSNFFFRQPVPINGANQLLILLN